MNSKRYNPNTVEPRVHAAWQSARLLLYQITDINLKELS